MTESQDRLWVFQRPLVRDPLVLISVALWLVTVIDLVLTSHHGPANAVVRSAGMAISSLLLVGTTLGSVRAYREGKASPATPSS